MRARVARILLLPALLLLHPTAHAFTPPSSLRTPPPSLTSPSLPLRAAATTTAVVSPPSSSSPSPASLVPPPSLLHPPTYLPDVERVAEAGGKLRLRGMNLRDIEALLSSFSLFPTPAQQQQRIEKEEEEGEAPTSRVAKQVFRWLYHKDLMLDTSIYEAVSSSTNKAACCLSRALCTFLDSTTTLEGGLRLGQVKEAGDGTQKLIMHITSGPAKGKAVESVLIPMVRGPQQTPRYTLCVSSQSGCAMGCDFCHTGKIGLLGSLSAGQIVEQYVLARRYLKAKGDDKPILRMVFMGMGEPFDNYNEVMKALSILTEQKGKLLLGPNKITVSTVGLVPFIERFAQESRCMLAISLHATTDEIRSSFMPVNKRYPLSTLLPVLKKHFPAVQTTSGGGGKRGGGGRGEETKRRTQRRRGPVAFEYVLLKDINDREEDAERLAQMTEGMDCLINLIEFNTHEGAVFLPSNKERIARFRAVLKRHGRLSTLRESKGSEEMGACGQLGDLAMGRRVREKVVGGAGVGEEI